ncbi:uncharacterized protein Fot_47699 [Forsythia ovata]|uniref:Uncharacterized protein n=1 Tax=Forsythia ovata TaxID=205694 RepID=A0ABD1QR40_9LAMI
MEWSQTSATKAYLDALKLCSKCKKECNSCEETRKLETNEFISALAAGMSSKLIVEVTTEASPLTVALAAAARQTGGKLGMHSSRTKNSRQIADGNSRLRPK